LGFVVKTFNDFLKIFIGISSTPASPCAYTPPDIGNQKDTKRNVIRIAIYLL
jgi:hypothetical protein